MRERKGEGEGEWERGRDRPAKGGREEGGEGGTGNYLNRCVRECVCLRERERDRETGIGPEWGGVGEVRGRDGG